MADPTARTKRSANAAAAAIVACVCVAACGFWWWNRPRLRAAAQGAVTLDNKPLDQAVIVFIPIPPLVGKQTGAEIKQGQYRIDSEVGLEPGDYRVEVHPYISPVGADGKYNDRATTKKLAAAVPNIPRRYSTGSTLKVTATAVNNQFDFQLTSKPDGSNISSQ